MARIHGKGGSVVYASGYTSHVKSWQLNRTLETADGSELGFVNKVMDAGLKDASGSYVAHGDSSAAAPDVGTTGTATFQMASGKTIAAKILITSVAIDVNLQNNVQYTIGWVLGGGDGSASDFVIT